jgi:hypothetical protein
MNFIANAADRLLGVIVPQATAAAFNCPPGSVRYTYGCEAKALPSGRVGYYWYDCCKRIDNGQPTGNCGFTVWPCR